MFLDMYDGNTYKKHTMVLSRLFRHTSSTVLPRYFRHVLYHGSIMVFHFHVLQVPQYYNLISLLYYGTIKVLFVKECHVFLYSLKYIEFHVNTMVHEYGIIQHHGITTKYRHCTIVLPQYHFPRVIVNIYFNSIAMQKREKKQQQHRFYCCKKLKKIKNIIIEDNHSGTCPLIDKYLTETVCTVPNYRLNEKQIIHHCLAISPNLLSSISSSRTVGLQ